MRLTSVPCRTSVSVPISFKHGPDDERLQRVEFGRPAADKIMRLHAQTATIENGFLSPPEAAHRLADDLIELAAFPMGPPRRPSRLARPGAGVGEAAPGRYGDDRLLGGAAG